MINSLVAHTNKCLKKSFSRKVQQLVLTSLALARGQIPKMDISYSKDLTWSHPRTLPFPQTKHLAQGFKDK